MVDNVYIVIDFAFPNGFAGASRIMSYAKGFAFHKTNTTILCIRKTENYNNVLNKSAKGKYHGVNFRYLSGTPIKSKYLLVRGIQNYFMVFHLFIFSLFCIKKNSCIIFYSTLTHAALLLKIASAIKGFHLIKEENEHPSVRTKVKKRLPAYIYERFHYRLFDGILVITRSLYNYFSRITYNKPVLSVPILVDFDRFKLKVKKEKTIIYSGMLSDQKDGISVLIRSFANISSDYPKYKLKLIGESNSEKELLKFKLLCEELDINDRVLFAGRIPNEEVPNEISKASILVLPRPDSIQARNGFSTKLGEYLATGSPVVVTSVGEISDYLTDHVNAFVSLPGSIDSLTKKLRESLENPELSSRIGLEGRITAEKYFDNKVQAERILSFINEL